MKMTRVMIVMLLIGISLSVSACNYQKTVSKPTDFALPTPNYTMTALFEPLLTQQTSQTPVAGTPVVTATPSTVEDTATTQPTATETATVAPTNTPANTASPTVSFAGPGKRKGTSLVAIHVKKAPTIDGNFGEWSNKATRYSVSHVVYGKKNRKNDKDLSAKVMFGWDKKYLYVAVRVKDDKYTQTQSGDNLYLGDSIEILMDTFVSADYYLASLSWDDYQLGISGGQKGAKISPEAYLWYPAGIRGSQPSVKIARAKTDNGYRLEAAIPWKVFNVTPYAGAHYGFAFSVSDNDTNGKAVQESMISTANRSLLNPMTWGDLTLGK